jgi:hypothetical protein
MLQEGNVIQMPAPVFELLMAAVYYKLMLISQGKSENKFSKSRS